MTVRIAARRASLFESDRDEMSMRPAAPERGKGRRPGHVLWREIEQQLAAELQHGAFGPGVRLPTEPELMLRFQVGRHTLRQAMAQLESKGLIRIEQGSGTFVNDAIVRYQISERTRFSKNLLEQGREPANQLTDWREVAAPLQVQTALGLADGEFVSVLEITAAADRIVIAETEAWFSLKQFPNIGPVYRRLGSTTETYRHFGIVDYVRQKTRIYSRLPSAREARVLKLVKTQPVLITCKTDTNLAGHPLSYSETRWASDRVELIVDEDGTGGSRNTNP